MERALKRPLRIFRQGEKEKVKENPPAPKLNPLNRPLRTFRSDYRWKADMYSHLKYSYSLFYQNSDMEENGPDMELIEKELYLEKDVLFIDYLISHSIIKGICLKYLSKKEELKELSEN